MLKQNSICGKLILIFPLFCSPQAKKKKSGGSPRKSVGDTKAGSGGAFKSKEFISSSDSSDNEGKSSKKKKKAGKAKAAKKEDSGSDAGSESDEPKEKKNTRSKGKPVAELKDGDEQFDNVSF